MGVYNPHAPRILGQEWVPVRDEDITFSPASNLEERGHRFTLTAATALQDARFYINDFPPGLAAGQVYMASVYPAGMEDQSGPIQEVIIPCNGGAASGGAQLWENGATTGTVARCVSDPSDQSYIESGALAPFGEFSAFFNTSAYTNLLSGARIVDVRLRYGIAARVDLDAGMSSFGIYIKNNYMLNQGALFVPFGGNSSSWGAARVPVDEVSATNFITTVREISLGEINHYWSTATDPTSTTERLPWTSSGLDRFEVSAANRQAIVIELYGEGIFVNYLALRVLYCLEQRVAYGGGTFGDESHPITGTGNIHQKYVYGTNKITMRSVTTGATSPVLPAGDYSLVISSPEVGNLAHFTLFPSSVESSAYPPLNACRQLYALPDHPGLQNAITQQVGETFVLKETSVLPQLSLHATGGAVLNDMHVYGRLARARVAASIEAHQDIKDSVVGGTADYPWVRFYARHFGEGTEPLLLDSSSFPGSTVDITPAELEALPEIIDGWREVTLRFDTPPSMGASTPRWDWTCAAGTTIDSWEILGAMAPAMSGVPGNLLNPVPTTQQLSAATYGQPVSGAGINLFWSPGPRSFAALGVDDAWSDATLIFAQDMPTVTDLTVTLASQAITGIGLNCDINPCCVPSAITYHSITWTATSSSVPASGFGYYELQRSDEVDPTWYTIAKLTSPSATGFGDYEARVGLESYYRIRAVDVLEFPGLWSSTITSTITDPGVTVGCNGHTLIFTSNEDPTMNLAYNPTWEGGAIDEDINYPEGSSVDLSEQYGRDFVVAYHGTERGGERFTRNILVQAAATASPNLSSLMSLRDLAWADLSYVCVRDEGGNRWFASIQVPSARWRRNRALTNAQVNVTEVTQTPSEVTV